jgi:hypothetical protein
LIRATTRSTFFAPHSSWGLGLDGQGVADPEPTEMNSAEGWHLKKGHIRRLEPFKVTPGDLAESSTFEDVTRRRVAVRTRVLVEGVLGPNFTTLSDHETIRVQGMVYRAGSILRRKRFRAAPGSWEIMLL